jgi:Co/Zn/Cd efflux system component
MILAAAAAVGVQIVWRLTHLEAPLVETMGIAAALNLAGNGVCLYLLNPFKAGDLNMSSAWACSRNDVIEGSAASPLRVHGLRQRGQRSMYRLAGATDDGPLGTA